MRRVRHHMWQGEGGGEDRKGSLREKDGGNGGRE